jgi:hypothetical protein
VQLTAVGLAVNGCRPGGGRDSVEPRLTPQQREDPDGRVRIHPERPLEYTSLVGP